MKKIILFCTILSLLTSCQSDDDRPPIECQMKENVIFDGEIKINNTLPFQFVNRSPFANLNDGLIFQKKGAFLEDSDTLIYFDVNSKTEVWSYNAEDYVQAGLLYLKEEVLYWNFLDVRSLDLNTFEEKVIADDSEINVGEYFSINYNHALYTSYSSGANTFARLWRKNLATEEAQIVFTDSLVGSPNISQHIIHPVEWENEKGDRFISFLTRFDDEFPTDSYHFYTLRVEDFSVLVKKPLLNYGRIKSTPFVRNGQFIYEFNDDIVGTDAPLISVNGTTGDVSWEIVGDVFNMQQADNDNEHIGCYLLVRIGLDLMLINSDTGAEVYRLSKQESISPSLYDNNTIILDDGKTVFYGFDGTFYGYNIADDCKILEIPEADFPEPYKAYAFDFENNQFIFEGETRMMLYSND